MRRATLTWLTLAACLSGCAAAVPDEDDVGSNEAPIIDERALERGVRYFFQRWYFLKEFHPRADFEVASANDTCSEARNRALLDCGNIVANALLTVLTENPWGLKAAQWAGIRGAIGAALGGSSFRAGWRCGRAIVNEFEACQVSATAWLKGLMDLYRTSLCAVGICFPDRELVDFWYEMWWILREYAQAFADVYWDNYDVCTCAYDGGNHRMPGSDPCCPVELPGQCTRSTDCPSGYLCVNGFCEKNQM